MRKRIRRGARIVLCRDDGAVLLFRFSYTTGVLAGRTYWALPGGGLEEGETPEEGALRELREETGILAAETGPVRHETEYDMVLMNGEPVREHDWYFVLRAGAETVLSRDGFTPEERETMAEARWWRVGEMPASGEEFMPPHLSELLSGIIRVEKS